MRYIGVHVSSAGGVHKALRRAETLNINAIQIFLKNARKWEGPHYKEEEIERFQEERCNFKDLKIFAHSSYLINLAAKGRVYHKSVRALYDEMKRAGQLNIEYIVLHPGSYNGNPDRAISRIARGLDRVFKRSANLDVNILLETTAGVGNNLGYKFEHLRDIINSVKNSSRIGVCLDTCHVFGAGYPINDEKRYNEVIDEFDRIIGLDKLKLMHLNDSKGDLKSKIDRHNHIGMGYLGEETFRRIMNDRRLINIPMILETPKVMEEYESDVILKDIPMILDRSRKLRFSLADTILKDIPTALDRTRKVRRFLSENALKSALKTIDKSINDLSSENGGVSGMMGKFKGLGLSMSENFLKDTLKIYENARKSVYEVDMMNLEKVYSLIEE